MIFTQTPFIQIETSLISSIISKFKVKHPDNKIHNSFEHMFYKDKFTILLFSLHISE